MPCGKKSHFITSNCEPLCLRCVWIAVGLRVRGRLTSSWRHKMAASTSCASRVFQHVSSRVRLCMSVSLCLATSFKQSIRCLIGSLCLSEVLILVAIIMIVYISQGRIQELQFGGIPSFPSPPFLPSTPLPLPFLSLSLPFLPFPSLPFPFPAPPLPFLRSRTP